MSLRIKASFYLVFLISFAFATQAQNANSWVVSAEEINWGYLNPLRGDKSPGAAELWGDRTKDVPTGMLVRFNKGFSSPSHIHNITYRGVVIKGLLHNDDPGALPLWMPTGSYWTQPAGENHITAANGEQNLIYLEIDSGPYLVKPAQQSFDNGERSLNMHVDNIVWQRLHIPGRAEQFDYHITYLWGTPEQKLPYGALIRFNAPFDGKIASSASEFRSVVIAGSARYRSSDIEITKQLTEGSYFGAEGDVTHHIATSENTVLYIRSDGKYRFQLNGEG